MGGRVALTEPVVDYLRRLGARESAALKRCRDETQKLPLAGMQIEPDQGAVLAMYAQLIEATRCIEIGVFTGYSALWVASVLPPNGHIIALDVSKEFTDMARGYWQAAGPHIEKKIDLRLGPALDALDRMIAASDGPFDFVFIDADKTNYDNYYERALKLLRVGGLIAFDNMLWGGAVADSNAQDEDTKALRALNAKIHADDRVDMALATVGDGMMLARKRK